MPERIFPRAMKKMSEIRRMIIENFQSHENTVLDFTKGLNVIVGPSDQGKSAVLRALKWVLYNEPRGMEFIRHGTSSAKVTVEMTNGFIIIRERSKSKNKYTVINPENISSVYEGFGNEVPEEVIKAHGIPRVVLDTDFRSSLNMSDQLEGPFLLSQTGAVRAKAIGRLTGVHIIDNAIRESMVDLRRENQSSERVKSELEENAVKLGNYDDLYLIEMRLKESEYHLEKLEHLIEKNYKLDNIKRKKEEVDAETSELGNTLQKLAEFPKCEELVKRSELYFSKLSTVKRLAENLRSIEEEINISNKVMFMSEKTDEAASLTASADMANQKLTRLAGLNSMLSNVNADLEKISEILNKTNGVENAVKIVKKIEHDVPIVSRLVVLNDNFNFNNTEITRINKFLVSSRKIEESEAVMEETCKRIDTLQRLLEARQQYDAITNYINEGEKYLLNNKAQVEQLLNEYSDYLKKIGKCPLCGSLISEGKIQDVVKHYKEAH